MKISVVFMPEYLMSAMQPHRNKFTLITRDGAEERFWLYFFVEPSHENIDFGLIHKKSWEAGAPGYFGDIYNSLIAGQTFGRDNLGVKFLLTPVLEKIRNKFIDNISQLSGSDNDPYSGIDVSAAMHPAVISRDSEEILRKTLKESFHEKRLNLTFSPFSFHQLMVKHLRDNGEISGLPLNVVILDALTDKLFLSHVRMNETGFLETLLQESFDNDGLDPRVRIISSNLIEAVNTYIGLSLSREAKGILINKYADMAADILKKLDKSEPIGLIQYNYTLNINNIEYNYVLAFSRKNIDESVQRHVYKIKSNLDQFVANCKLNHQMISSIIILGNNLMHNNFHKQLGYEKVRIFRTPDVFTALLKELHSGISVNAETIMPENTEAIVTSDLEKGSECIMEWVSSKGQPREVRFVYSGNNLFSVVNSKNCDLVPGMSFTSVKLELNKVNALNVTGKGKFNTGVLTILKTVKN